jgi:hypothetical protein
MAQIIISKIKFRRGTNTQRQFVVLDQGEAAVTTDTGRLYIGTGTLSGGIVVGSKIHSPLINFFSLSSLVAELNDVVVANNKLYQLTSPDYTNISSWTDISTQVDPAFFSYDVNNFLTLNLSTIDAVYLDPSTIGVGLKIDGGILQLDYSTTSLEITANQVNVKADGISEREIISTTLSSGLIGGSGAKVQLDVDPTYFSFSGNSLTLSSGFPLSFSSLNASWFGAGLDYNSVGEVITSIVQDVDGTTIVLNAGIVSVNPDIFGAGLPVDTVTGAVSANVTDVDNVTITKVLSSGIISLPNLSAAKTVEWPYITVDNYGRVTNVQSAVYDILECNPNLNPTHSIFGPLSSIFNGNPTGIISGGADPTNITKFKVLSSDYVTVLELSSAGFLMFEGNYTTRASGDTIPRFAIPIFRF